MGGINICFLFLFLLDFILAVACLMCYLFIRLYATKRGCVKAATAL